MIGWCPSVFAGFSDFEAGRDGSGRFGGVWRTRGEARGGDAEEESGDPEQLWGTKTGGVGSGRPPFALNWLKLMFKVLLALCKTGLVSKGAGWKEGGGVRMGAGEARSSPLSLALITTFRRGFVGLVGRVGLGGIGDVWGLGVVDPLLRNED